MSHDGIPRHYSGILVTARPGRFDETLAAVGGLAHAEVHHPDPASGRCVAVIETFDRASQEEIYRQLHSLPSVAHADLVYHLIDDPESGHLVAAGDE